MANLFDLIKQKSERLNSIPLKMQNAVEKQQRVVFNDIVKKLSRLELDGDTIKINSTNLNLINEISDELKSVLLNDEYKKTVQAFVKQFDVQAELNDKIVKAALDEDPNPMATRTYLNLAKRNAVQALTGSPIDSQFLKPVTSILENAVVNGATINATIDNIRTFVEGNKDADGKILKYVKQITHDSFAVADRSYTSIVSDYLDAEWFYFAGTEVESTRCFCHERVDRYFHYKEIESWADGENLGDCNIGDGKWAGMIPGTNRSTIYSYLGGYGCLHSLMPVSEGIVPKKDIQRAIDLGYIEITNN